MNEQIKQALQTERTIDITTTGRQSGEPRRIEIWFHNVDDEIYITGLPGKRSWYANMMAHPEFTFHLKQSVSADLNATATPITEPNKRHTILARIVNNLNHHGNLEDWVERSPLIHVTFT